MFIISSTLHFAKYLALLDLHDALFLSFCAGAWEATLFNLAHAFRRLKKYDLAIEWYNRAKSVGPRNHTVSSIAKTISLGMNYISKLFDIKVIP